MTPRGYDRFMVETAIGSNPKINRLTDGEFRCLITGVWALAAKADPRGSLQVAGQPATARDIASQAGCPVAVASRTIDKLHRLYMLETDAKTGLVWVHDWDQINPPPKVDITAAERQRRRRARLARASRHGDVTRDSHGRHALEVEVEELQQPAGVAPVRGRAREADGSPTADHIDIDQWRPLPQPPRSHGSRAEDQWHREVETWCMLHLPGIPRTVAVDAAVQAIVEHRAESAHDLLEHLTDPDYPYSRRRDVRAQLKLLRSTGT